MTEEIKPEVIKKTQESLGKYVKRPPLTEKLLRKPPFRFLHDIVTCVIRDTGLMNGVFSPEELNHENIKGKEKKLAFLQKLIEAVKAASGSSITARPSKIVAGHEPTKTNELLQAIAKAVDKKLAGEEAGSPQHADPPKAAKRDKESHSRDEGKKKSSDKKVTQSRASSREQKIRESKEPSMKKSSSENVESKHSKMSGSKKSEGHTVESSEARHKKGTTETHKKKKVDVRAETAEAQKPESIVSVAAEPGGGRAAAEQQAVAQPQAATQPQAPPETDDTAEKEQQEIPAAHDIPSKKGKRSARQAQVNEENESDKLTEVNDKNKDEKERPAPAQNSQETEKTTVVPETPPADMKKITSSSSSNITNNNIHDGEGSVSIPKVNVMRPKTARMGSARPMSARPAAPRIRDRGEVVVPAEVQPVVMKVNIITENDKMAEQDENENYVVEAQDHPAMEIMSSPPPVDVPAADAPHGHLVSQILETQKELEEKRPTSADSREAHLKRVDIEWEDGLRRERDTATKEVERLRSSIQTLTRAANPLGKWMDFLQEDVDTMQRELEMWKATNKELKLQLVQEQSQTHQLIEPLRRQLQHLGKATEDQRELITALKSKILQNDAYIHKVVT